jgi:hypothetical protein
MRIGMWVGKGVGRGREIETGRREGGRGRGNGKGKKTYHGGIGCAPAEVRIGREERFRPGFRSQELVARPLPVRRLAFLQADEDVLGVVDVDLVEDVVFWERSLCKCHVSISLRVEVPGDETSHLLFSQDRWKATMIGEE